MRTLWFLYRPFRRYVSLFDAARELERIWLIRASGDAGREEALNATPTIAPAPDRVLRPHADVQRLSAGESLLERAYTGATSRPDIRASRFPSTRPRINAEVWFIIQKMLLDGTLAAYIQANSGQIEALSPETWTEGTLVDVTERKRVTGDVLECQVSGKVLLPRRQVAALLRLASKIKSEGRRDPENPGGRPAKYDSEAFLIEAFRLLFDRKLNPRMPADLWRGVL